MLPLIAITATYVLTLSQTLQKLEEVFQYAVLLHREFKWNIM